jgi:hypothetical protein
MGKSVEKDPQRKERKTPMPEATVAEAQEKKPATNPDEVALELMKFVAVTTGYGRGNAGGPGFGVKGGRSSEEYADALLELFERCRSVVRKEPK